MISVSSPCQSPALFSALLVTFLLLLVAPGPAAPVSSGRAELGPPPRPEAYWLRPRVRTPRAPGLAVDTSSRTAVTTFFETVYEPAFDVPIGWTGSVAGCVAGVTSAAYLQATLDVLNFFRAMAGLPGDVTFKAEFNAKDQDAALMMIANGENNHFPPPTWDCYTAGGAEAAGSSNLALGFPGPLGVVSYINDFGAPNVHVAHRRWVIYPPQRDMGTGSNDGVNGFDVGVNALYVTANSFGPRPADPEWVAFPPAGFVPFELIYPPFLSGVSVDRWSLSRNLEEADFPDAPPDFEPSVRFDNADVAMTFDGVPVPLTVVSRTDQFGDATLVWEPAGLSFPPGTLDRTYNVSVTGIEVNGQTVSHTYDVTVFDPDVEAPSSIFTDGFESGDTSSWTSSTP